MTNDTEAQLPVPVAPAKSVKLWPIWLFMLIMLIAVAALAVYGWGELKKMEQMQLKIDFVEERDSNQNQGLTRLEDRLGKRFSTIEENVLSQAAALTKQNSKISYNTTQLALVGGQSRTDWLFAEAEYLLRLANQRLQMEKDFKGAEAIMNAAENVLSEADDPGLYPVREQLAKEVMSLQRVSAVDREGIYLKIEALIDLTENIDQRYYLSQDQENFSSQLTLDNTPDPDPAQSEMSRLLEQMAGELKKLVVIRRLDEPVEPLLAPEQIYYLKQNLRLMLEQAELALLSRNQDMYDRSLTKAEAWVESYFLKDRQDTVLLLTTLAKLKQHQVNPEIPDISESLRLLKERIALSYRQHKVTNNTPKTTSAKKQPTTTVPTAKPASVSAPETVETANEVEAANGANEP